MENVIYEAVWFSDCGKIRTVNEDSCLLRQCENNAGQCLLAAVADGMGGLSQGRQASSMLMQALEEWWQHERLELLQPMQQAEDVWVRIEQSLDDYIACANRRILQQDDKMGTTLSLIFLWNQRYLVKHAGDSRIYFMHSYGLEQLTKDHTWYEQERQQGTLAERSEPIAKLQSVLVNAIGVRPQYHLDVAKGDLDNVDLILLCSDGVYKYWSFSQLEQLLCSRKSLSGKGRRLESVLQQSEARDNYTAILIEKRKSGGCLAEFRRILGV